MSDLVHAGLEIMLIGMGTVFFFLALLVFFSTMMSRLVHRITPPQDTVDLDRDNLAAVISAAVTAHRNK